MATVISAPGDFSPSALLQVKAKAEEMWADGQFNLEYEPNSQSAQAVLANQTAKFTPLEQSDKDNTMLITWLNACNITDAAYDPECDITGPELSSNSQTAELDIERQVTFKIDHEKIRTNTYSMEEQAALGQLTAIKALDEFWNKTVLAKIKSFAGTNNAPLPYSWNAADNYTEIPNASYNRKLISWFIKNMQLNKIPSFYMLDGGMLYEDWLNAAFDEANSDGKGDGARIKALKKYFDLFGFGAAGLDEDTFMVGTSAVAMATQNRFTSRPVEIGGKVNETVYSVPSRTLPGISYDVTYQLKCEVSGSAKRYLSIWKFHTKGGVFLNPAGCSGATGVLGFKSI